MKELTVKTKAQMHLDDEYSESEYIPAPCQQGCPIGTDIPSYVGLIAQQNLDAAFEVISAANPFPSICGRVCAMPCESQCRRRESDGAVAIRNLKRFVTETVDPDNHDAPFQVTKSGTIAIVGAGPAGLTSARDLAEAGYEVHLYEKSGTLGGMMAQGIPPFRLPRRFVESDIKRILDRCPGIKVHLNSALGDRLTLHALKARHDVVLLALGLWNDRRLGVPGEEEGIDGLYGIRFLTDLNQRKIHSLHGNVVVVGGGNVAIDVARTAIRAGASKVELFCLEARDGMPAWEYEIREAIDEGIEINPSWGPKQIIHKDGKVIGVEFMRCTSVFNQEGYFNPSYDPKTVTAREVTAIFVAIGLALENSELEQAGLLVRGRIRADFETMRTSDPGVFAAGDGAFGPSAIVHAIHHGHRAAHYIKAYLEGIEDPEPFTVLRTSRQVPIIQDPQWEQLNREEQERRGWSDSPFFEECDLTYDLETARRQAVRCLRCDTETGIADYSRRTREHIHAMARTKPGDTRRLSELLHARLRPRNNPFPPDRPAHLDDLVFLPAALTRLVIDPYREACSTKTQLGKSLTLEQPYLFMGFDDTPREVQDALTLALNTSGCAYIGFRPLPDPKPIPMDDAAEPYTMSRACDSMQGKLHGRPPWLQLIRPGVDVASRQAAGLIYIIGEQFEACPPDRHQPDQLLGISTTLSTLPQVIPYALENGFDLLLLDGTTGFGKELYWSELEGSPNLTIMRESMRILRKLNREEDIDLVYFGGLRSGTDVAKILAINCKAGVFNIAMAIAMGGVIADRTVSFNGGLSIEDRHGMAENWIKGTAEETSIIARCTGKTNVHNLEPEDMRSITLATSEATDISLASGRAPRDYF